jgi:hypothetical protein
MGVDNLDSLSYRSLATRPFVLVSDRPDHRRRAYELLRQKREERRIRDGEDILWRPAFGRYRWLGARLQKFAWKEYEALPAQSAK